VTTNAWIVFGVAIVAIVAIAAWLFARRQRSMKLRSQFGLEYDHAVQQYGSLPKAEDALLARQKRVNKFQIHYLDADEAKRFADQWHQVQSRFVDDPAGSIDKADQLVCELMRARGYPMSEFEGRAEDLSVDYPDVVRNYRAAHAVAIRRPGESSTEDLRQALVHYRQLFDELLEAQLASKGHITRRDI
jgi:hypothetical protein